MRQWSAVSCCQPSSKPLRRVRPAFWNVARPPLLVAVTISSRVRVWNSAAVSRPPASRAFAPTSRLSFTEGRSPKLSPLAPPGRYDSSLSVGVSKPRPTEPYTARSGVAW
ncbi:hypothetical protein D9M68_521290 [compost metagenome]